MSDAVIQVENLGKRYQLGLSEDDSVPYRTVREDLARAARNLFRRKRPSAAAAREFWALREINFEVQQGDVVGIIGRNGAGKSTLLKILSRITEPTEGKIRLGGRVASLLEVGTGFHQELTGRENIFLNGAILGMRGVEIKRKFDEIVAFAEVERFLDTPVKRYSSGMYVRLAFAVAAHLEPEILIIDEVLAVGDSEFQKKCLGKMRDVSSAGRTVLFVSHNMQTVRQLCRYVFVLDKGRLAYTGNAADGILKYFGGSGTHVGEVDLSRMQRKAARGAARLKKLRFLSHDGAPAERLRSKDRVRIDLELEVFEPIENFDLAMAVIHADGAPVFSETISDVRERERVERGHYHIDFSFDLSFLKIEAYFLTIHLYDGDDFVDGVEGVAVPEISNETADSFKESRRWGVVRLPVSWSRLNPSAT